MYAQGYYAYDSKKAGGVTRSHLRFGSEPIHKTYYINNADFISVSLDSYMFKYDLANNLKKGGTFLLNTSFDKDEIVKHMPNRLKRNSLTRMLSSTSSMPTRLPAKSEWVVVPTPFCSLHSSR